MVSALAPSAPPVIRRRFTASEYYTMLNAGVFHEDDRLELVEGEIVEMSPINPAHAGHITRLTRVLTERLGQRALFGVQNPLDLGDDSQPQPDVMVLKPRDDFYEHAHPTPVDGWFLIEVADSSVDYDRNVKAPLYARSGVRELWIVNLPDQRLELYRDLAGKDYKTRQLVERGETFAALAFPEIQFRVEDILG